MAPLSLALGFILGLDPENGLVMVGQVGRGRENRTERELVFRLCILVEQVVVAAGTFLGQFHFRLAHLGLGLSRFSFVVARGGRGGRRGRGGTCSRRWGQVGRGAAEALAGTRTRQRRERQVPARLLVHRRRTPRLALHAVRWHWKRDRSRLELTHIYNITPDFPNCFEETVRNFRKR